MSQYGPPPQQYGPPPQTAPQYGPPQGPPQQPNYPAAPAPGPHYGPGAQPNPQYAPPPQQYGPPPQQPQYGPPAGQPQYGPPQGGQYAQPHNAAAPGYAQRHAPNPGMFAGVGQARQGGRFNYMKPGRYWVRIDNVEIKDNQRGTLFAVEGTVVHVIDNRAGYGHRVGETVTRTAKRGNWYFLPEINGFLSGAMGVPEDSITPEQVSQGCGPDQPLKWTIVQVYLWEATSQQNKPITKAKWEREVPYAEALATLDPQAQATYFPDGWLQRMAALDAQRGKVAPPAQQYAPQGQLPQAPQQYGPPR